MLTVFFKCISRKLILSVVVDFRLNFVKQFIVIVLQESAIQISKIKQISEKDYSLRKKIKFIPYLNLIFKKPT